MPFCLTEPRSALKVAVAYAKDRQSFGQPLFNHQAVGFRLAECATQLEAERQLTWHDAALRDAGRPCLKEAAMAKLFASEMAEKVCSAAIQTLGGYGYVNDFPLERIYRDVRVCQICEGTSDVQKMLIQRGLWGASFLTDAASRPVGAWPLRPRHRENVSWQMYTF